MRPFSAKVASTARYRQCQPPAGTKTYSNKNLPAGLFQRLQNSAGVAAAMNQPEKSDAGMPSRRRTDAPMLEPNWTNAPTVSTFTQYSRANGYARQSRRQTASTASAQT